MFLSAGNILHASGHDRIKDLDGFTHVLPVSAFAFGLAGLSLVGLPPARFCRQVDVIERKPRSRAVVVGRRHSGGSLLAAAYVMRVLTHAFTQMPDPTTPNPVPSVMEWTALAMAVLAVGWPGRQLAGGTASLRRAWCPGGVGP